MTTMANTIRWSRKGNSQFRNKSTSLIESPAEDFKLPALNALNKSIKYGDLSFATNHDLRKLRKQPQQVENIQEVSAHHSLMVIRKKYDNMNKAKEALQSQVQDLQHKRNKFLSQKNRFDDQKNNGSLKVQTLQTDLNQIKHNLEQSEVEKKVMMNMIQRIKHDKIVYDLRKYKLQKQLTYIQKQKQIILKQNAGKMQESQKTKKIYQKLVDHLQAQKRERQQHLQNMTNMISQKVTLNQNLELRKSEMKQIGENILQDKDPEQKNWYKCYLCCRFVEKLLKDKMNRQMSKFNTVQIAFKNIKTQTGVSNTNDLVKKFLNKQHAYGELLGKIAQNERRIINLKGENEDLMKERRRLQNEQDILNSNRKQLKNMNKQQKQFNFMSNKSKNDELLMVKLKDWIIKNLKKFNNIDNNQIQIKQQKMDIILYFKKYLMKIAKSIQDVKDINHTQKNIESLGGNNLRIILNPQQQLVDNKNIEFDEDDFINNQRNQMIKNNDKFMKQVKKKYQDIKKAKLQAQPKKKEVIIQKPKPVPI